MKKLALAMLLLSACSITPEIEIPTFTPDQPFETMINEVRKTPLSWSPLLQKAADIQSNYMDSTKYYNHVWKDGTTFAKRLVSVGCYYEVAAENIAFGHRTESEALQGWMDSPAHRNSILANRYNLYAISHKGIYWTLVLGWEEKK